MATKTKPAAKKAPAKKPAVKKTAVKAAAGTKKQAPKQDQSLKLIIVWLALIAAFLFLVITKQY